MIDIQGPEKKNYTLEEEVRIKEEFILLLHTLLLVYLTLHNFFIPVMSNLLRSQSLLIDIHFWFLFHLPLQWWLRTKKSIPASYLQFLVLGSVLRLGIELYSAPDLKSWAVLSLLVSELSSGIFYYLYVTHSEKISFSTCSLLAFLIVPSLGHFEQRCLVRPLALAPHQVLLIDDTNLGCQGSSVNLLFPYLRQMNSSTEVSIKDCGFSENLIRPGHLFKLTNLQKTSLNLRLYRMSVLHGKVRWRFMRMIKLAAGESWNLSLLLGEDLAYLVKSPEKRKTGHLVILPSKTKHFPFGKGELQLHYDTISWSGHE